MTFKAKGIFIPFNTPSSKNSKRLILKEGRKPLIINSKLVMEYKKKTKFIWLEKKQEFEYLIKNMSNPLIIGFHFVRNSKRKHDLSNTVQIIQDLMQEFDWIEDDSSEFLVPIFFKMKGSYTTYSKENPGCWICPITPKILNELNGNLNE